MAADRPTRTLVRGLAVLGSLAEADDDLSLTEVSQRVNLDKATSLRLLKTLVLTGYVTQASGGPRYGLASKVARLGARFTEAQAFRDVALPHLERLRDVTNETVHLGHVLGNHAVYIAKLDTSQSVRLTSAVGQTMQLHTTGLGKALLAWQSPENLGHLISRLDFRPKQPASIRSSESLCANLNEIRERGYSIEIGENEKGVACVGAAVVTEGEVLGGLSVAGPDFRITPFAHEFGELAVATAQAIAEDEVKMRAGLHAVVNSY